MDNYISIDELVENKEYDKALSALLKLYKKNRNSSYLVKMAQIYRIKKEDKFAFKILHTAYKKMPDAKLAREIAMTYFYNQKYKKAIEYYKNQIDLEGITPDNLYDLACSYHYDNNFIEAYKNYLNVLNIDKKNIKALNNLGCLYYETNNYKDAFETFNNSINILRKNPEAYYYLGILYREYLNDKELSTLYLKKAIFYDPNHKETYLELEKTSKLA